ncbi:hypothetical protein BGZ82_008417 [Podila clonocystis]|nr:hypothetical protein BGZ82_008417 [Podila clonocystis]
MFDITELDEMVCAMLDQGSLVRCAQVNKKWNKVSVPFVWKTIPKTMTKKGWREFRKLVLEDYQQEQQRREQTRLQQQPPPAKKARKSKSTDVTEPISQPPKPLENMPLLALTRYGQLVREVEEFAYLLASLESPYPGNGKLDSKEHSDPSAPDLARHFLKRCPNALLQFQVDYDLVKSKRLYPVVLEAMSRVDTLAIKGKSDAAKGADVSSPSLPSVHGPEISARPKKLNLIALDEPNRSANWSWIWRACSQVEEIEISGISRQLTRNLAQGIRDDMPCLDTVSFGKKFSSASEHSDDGNLQCILAAGTKGWKSVHCGYCSQMGSPAFDALLQHASSLEELSIVKVLDRTGILRVLKSCPKLRKLTTIDDGRHAGERFAEVDAQDFIDWDPELNTVRPWVSTTKLETLAIKITGVGLQNDHRRFFETHQRVCERLGEFKALKVLTLGHNAEVRHRRTVWINRWRTGYRTTMSTVPKQEKCVCLTLTTGLDKLGGMKKLEELHIPNMDHHITEEQEVEWMVDNWPELSKVRGLGVHMKAHNWLKKHHSEIQLE